MKFWTQTMHLTLRFILNTMRNNETQLGWYKLIATLTRTLLPRRWQNYGRKWCKLWPAEAKTLYAGSLMRVWLTMDQKWNQEQWSRRYWQHLRLQADASVRKKRVWLDYLDLCAAGTKATAHLDVPKASSNRDGRLNSNSCPLIFFRHLFALGLPDVSCLASAHF